MKDKNQINTEFINKNLNMIWNMLKIHKKMKVKSNLKAENVENHFNVLIQDIVPLNADQVKIQSDIQERASHLSKTKHEVNGRGYKCKYTNKTY